MKQIERYHPSIMRALFTAGLFHASVGTLMLNCLNEAQSFLYIKFFIYCFLVQQTKPSNRTFFTLILLSSVFSLISFSTGLSVFVGLIFYNCMALTCFKLVDLEPIDSIKLTFFPLLFSLFLFIFFEEKHEAISINCFYMLLQAIIFCSYTNINTGYFAHQQDIKNNLIFNRGFVILTSVVYCLRQILYLIATSITSFILTILSFVASCFISLFSGIFMILGNIMYSLLSLIPMDSNGGSPLNPSGPSAPPDQLDEVLSDVQGLSLPDHFWKIVGILLFIMILSVILRLVMNQIKQSPHRPLLQQEHREWINPQEKKPFSIFKKKETNLTAARKKYRSQVNELIKLDYPYQQNMTPLEYLDTLPQELIREKSFDMCTEEYLIARYKNNE